MKELNNRLFISGESIQELYNWYSKKTLIVNRLYQRKLVWTLNEKQKLIDTISRDYPIPLFLLAEMSDGKNEIIDGMQRFSSIFHFIENDFSFNGKFFDLETLATTNTLKKEGILVQKEPILDREICTKIANYKLAISIYKKDNNEIINDIFSRINSYGKKLSRQEIRQVGTTEEFPELVKSIAVKIRGDVSHSNILELNKMKNISIDMEDGTNNTIRASEIFWCKQNILTKNDIRDSEDEALIANILVSILTNIKYRISNNDLDYFYGKPTSNNDTDIKKANERKKELSNSFNSHGKEKIESDFFVIFDLIKSLDININSKRNFIALFIALHNLYFNKNKEIKEKDNFIAKIYLAISKLETTQGGVWAKENIQQSVSLIEDLVTHAMKDSPKVAVNTEKITEIENILAISQIESIHYDIKQGLHNLDTISKFNNNLFIRLMETICAISNNGKNEKGYIIIGVADKHDDKIKIEKQYNAENSSRQCNDYFITGLNGEISNYDSFDSYYKKVSDLFEVEKKKFKNLGKCLLEPINYYDRNLLVFRIESSNEICSYDNKVYLRVGSQTKEAEAMQIIEIVERFK